MNGKLTFQLDAGFLVATGIKAEIERFCFINDLKCEVKEFGGIFTKKFAFVIVGDQGKLRKAKVALGEWFKKVGG